MFIAKLGIPIGDYDERFKAWDTDGSSGISEDEFVAFCKKELDNGGPRHVVVKLMKRKDQFERECASREENQLNPQFVVGARETMDESHGRFFDDLKQVRERALIFLFHLFLLLYSHNMICRRLTYLNTSTVL